MKAQRLGIAEWSLLGYARPAVFLKTDRRPLPWVLFLASFDMSMWPSLVWGASEKEFAKIIELTGFFFLSGQVYLRPHSHWSSEQHRSSLVQGPTGALFSAGFVFIT